MVLLKSSVLKDCAFEGWRFPSVTFFEYHSSNLPSPSLNLASLLPIILFSLTNCTWHPIWIHYFVFFQFSFYTFLIYLLVFFFFSFFNQYINNYDRFYFFAKFYFSISLWCLPNQCPSGDDFEEKCSYIHADTIKPMRIKDILIKKNVFAVRQHFRIRIRHIMEQIFY